MQKKPIHTYVLIFLIIVVMAVLTYIVPSGEFQRKDVKLNNGSTKTLVVANSYKHTDPDHQGLKEVLMAPIKGTEDAVSVVAFLLIIGGSFGIISRRGNNTILHGIHSTYDVFRV